MANRAETWLSAHPRGVVLTLKVQPRSKRLGPLRVQEDGLRWGVQSPPVDGRANDELIGSVADFFGCRRQQVSLMAGASSRRKAVLIEDVVPEELLAALRGAGIDG